MKIIIVGQFGKESFGLHIKEALESMGHKVVKCVSYINEPSNDNRNRITFLSKANRKLFEMGKYASKQARTKVMRRIMHEVCSTEADLVICTKDYFLNYEVEEIRERTHARIALWYPDGILSLGRATFLRAPYDAVFFKDSYVVDQLVKLYGKNAFYLPECFSRTRHKPMHVDKADLEKYGCEVAMMGNLHSYRVTLLEQLSDYDLRIYGTKNPWWLDVGGIEECYTGTYVADEEKAKAIACAKIQLNTLHIGEVFSVNVRTFELAGAGGFQLCQEKADLPDLFVPDEEIVTYRTLADLREKIDWYLLHEDERKKIASAGLKRAWRDHYYELRLQRLLSMTFAENVSDSDRFDYKAMG